MLPKQPMTYRLDPEVENKIESGHLRIMAKGEKSARHLAERNRPEPKGDRLIYYTGDIQAGYSKLAAEVLQTLQPASHFPEAKVDADFYRNRCTEIDASIEDLERKNQDDKFTIENNQIKGVGWRLFLALLVTGLVFLGEAIFNTKAFLVTGDNLAFALLLSISLSFAVFIFSHGSVLLYKSVRKKLYRRLIVAGSLLLVSGIFVALAIFRSRYLEAYGIVVEPKFFVMINFFFFITSALVSFFVLPSWQELKENNQLRGIYRKIRRRKRVISQLVSEKKSILNGIRLDTKSRLRVNYLAKYVLHKVQMMHREALANFISTNLNFRKDGLSPTCFSDPVEDISIDIDNTMFTQLKLKSDENDNS